MRVSKPFWRNRSLLVIVTAVLVIWAFLPSHQSYAQDSYSGFVPGPLNGKCEACHSGSSLDKFGLDFGAVPTHASDPAGAIQTLANVDSDGDGFTNEEELTEGTYPGDSSSFPARANAVDLPVVPLLGLLASMLLAAVVIFAINRKILSEVGTENTTRLKPGKLSPALEALERDYRSGLVDETTYRSLKEEYAQLSRNDDGDA
jgi:hypothetical protein